MKKLSSKYVSVLLSLIVSSLILVGCTVEKSRVADNKAAAPTGEKEIAVINQSSSNSASSTANTSAAAPFAQDRQEEAKSVNGERYAEIAENPFLETSRAPLSTFSIDVDTAAYANVRRYLNDGQMPPKDAVRIEELVNYFEYDYPQPIGDVPFSVSSDAAVCPWNAKHKLVQIGLQGKKVSLDDVPPSNLVFLVDVSGSMNESDKLPLLKESLKILINQLTNKDRIAIVTYAGNSGLALPSTAANRKGEILSALNNLESGGSTNGGQGIQLAYQVALDNFIQGGNNRVILATDGDFNVGLKSDGELVNMIENKRQTGVFLSVLGFGTGNTNDSMMEKLADKGNGNYSYIDSREEAKKALGQQVAGTLYTIAEDVKIQVEFNPARIAGYRLIGYENRLLANRDFSDDRKDAGEIGAGHSVTAIYELVPAGQKVENDGIELKYAKTKPTDTNFNDEMMTVKLRYKNPGANESKLLTVDVLDQNKLMSAASENLKFAAAVAEFGLILRNSSYKGGANFENVTTLAQDSTGEDLKNYRGDFLGLVKKAQRLRQN